MFIPFIAAYRMMLTDGLEDRDAFSCIHVGGVYSATAAQCSLTDGLLQRGDFNQGPGKLRTLCCVALGRGQTYRPGTAQ